MVFPLLCISVAVVPRKEDHDRGSWAVTAKRVMSGEINSLMVSPLVNGSIFCPLANIYSLIDQNIAPPAPGRQHDEPSISTIATLASICRAID